MTPFVHRCSAKAYDPATSLRLAHVTETDHYYRVITMLDSAQPTMQEWYRHLDRKGTIIGLSHTLFLISLHGVYYRWSAEPPQVGL